VTAAICDQILRRSKGLTQLCAAAAKTESVDVVDDRLNIRRRVRVVCRLTPVREPVLPLGIVREHQHSKPRVLVGHRKGGHDIDHELLHELKVTPAN
jgi:hypothetical protein